MNRFSTGSSILRLFYWHTRSHKAMLLYLFNTFKRSQVCFCVSSVHDAAGHLALWDTRCLLTTCLHNPVMVNQSNKYEWEHLQFPFFLMVSFPFIYLFFWQWEHFLQLLVCSHEPQAAVLGASYAEKVTSPDDSVHCPSAAPLTLIWMHWL